MHALQAVQRADHRLASGQLRSTRIGAELTLPRVPHHDHAGQNAEQNLRDEACDEETGAATALVAEQHPIYDEAHYPRQEYDERVQDTLEQRQRDHVAVRDVSDFVAEHGLDLALTEPLQKP